MMPKQRTKADIARAAGIGMRALGRAWRPRKRVRLLRMLPTPGSKSMSINLGIMTPPLV